MQDKETVTGRRDLVIELKFGSTEPRCCASLKGKGMPLRGTLSNQLECIRTQADMFGISASLIGELEMLLGLRAVTGDHELPSRRE